ncbi:MAG: sigma factor-like helix-turn-helix DNA-binding protein [Candidatus Faecousia sp.]|nr:sigma factor-like helix-turn-helix DNA-binding protein [Candidatus Faecousia sp.]
MGVEIRKRYEIEEYSIAEIASTLHCSQGAVKSQLSRGRKLLKSMLAEDLEP